MPVIAMLCLLASLVLAVFIVCDIGPRDRYDADAEQVEAHATAHAALGRCVGRAQEYGKAEQ